MGAMGPGVAGRAGSSGRLRRRTEQSELATVPVGERREQLDALAGCSNGPDLVAELRRRGLRMPCTRRKKKDRDLFDCWPGVYYLTEQDRRKLNEWKRQRASKGQE